MSSEHMAVAVFLLAENRLLRDVFSRMLARKSDIRVVGASSLSAQTVPEITTANPDVVLFDSVTAALSIDVLLPQLRRNLPNLKIVMFGMDCDEQEFLVAVHRGVTGYVLKEASAAEVAASIRSVSNGEAVCPPSLCRALFEYVASSATWKPGLQVRKNLGLTRREQQLVQLVSEGLTNKEIASRLYLSEQTVKNHLRRMLPKAGGSDRLEAVEWWRSQGFWT